LVLQISVYLSAFFSSMMLAFAEGAFWPQGLTIPLGLIALVVNEWTGRIRISNVVANVLGVGALLLVLGELLSDNIEARLLSGAHLLVYLTWITFFQAKETRQYWWLMALGLLQVAVSSVLTTSSLYGFLLLFYVPLSIWTLSVFSLYRAERRFRLEEHQESVKGESRSGATSGRGENQAERSPSREAWNFRQRSVARGTVSRDPDEQWISLRFVTGTAFISIASLAVAILFFLMIPRQWLGNQVLFSPLTSSPVTSTGISDNMQLGQIGTILESRRLALEVRCWEFIGEKRQRVDVAEQARRLGYDEPLFRGPVRVDYREGKWSGMNSVRSSERPFQTQIPGILLQEYRLQPGQTEVLFAMYPVVSGAMQVEHDGETALERVSFHNATSSLYRPRSSAGQGLLLKRSVEYMVTSPKSPLNAGVDGYYTRISERGHDIYTSLPPNLERLQAEAVLRAGIDLNFPQQVDKGVVAQRLVDHLRETGGYTYTLNMAVTDRTIDPIEDFLLNRRSGHCEYFASALALMLRAVDIPARLVTGYKGGTLNPDTGYFEVEQRHAHAWVEAFIDNRWVTLDPTPAAREEAVASVVDNRFSFRNLKQMFNEIWNYGFVNIGLSQQQQHLYEPIKRHALELWHTVTSERGGIWKVFRQLLTLLTSPDEWFSWKTWVAVFFVLTPLALLLRLLIRIFAPWLRRAVHRVVHPAAAIRIVQFYERFQQICQARGMTRSEHQTQREFAAMVNARFQPRLIAAGLDGFPIQLAETFYQLRFSEQPIDAPIVARLEQQLGDFERATLPTPTPRNAPAPPLAPLSQSAPPPPSPPPL